MDEAGKRGHGGEETVGERIRRLRRERGLSLRRLSSPGVSFTYLSRIESGARTPSVQVIRKLARRLSVSPQYLETGIELTTREELELALTDAELKVRLEPQEERIERDFQAIIKLAEREGELDIAARAQGALGMACAGWGQLSQARDLLEAAIVHPTVTPPTCPDIYTALIRVHHELGGADRAVALCEQILSEAHPDDGALRTLVATYLSEALAELGEFERAESVIRETGDEQSGADDPYARARTHWLLARVAAMQDERRLALRHMREAIVLLKGTEDTVRLARAHAMCALILLWGGQTDGAERHVRGAIALLPGHSDATDQGRVKSAAALFAARENRFEDAALLADEALELLREDERDQTTALYAKALALAAAGDVAEAESTYERALAILEKSSLWREASVVARDRGRLWTQAGDRGAAARWRAHADELEGRVGSKSAAR
jgi:tetratricopeptide (TPR) repeat protein